MNEESIIVGFGLLGVFLGGLLINEFVFKVILKINKPITKQSRGNQDE